VKPVFQTRVGDGQNGTQHGNCVAACYASLFELPLDAIPEMSDPAIAPSQFWAEERFLAARGLGLVFVERFGAVGPGAMLTDAYYMASGTSPRGYPHRVIYQNGALAHDPHPDGGGLVEVRGFYLFVPVDPARPAP
jgi:hypothetical protein